MEPRNSERFLNAYTVIEERLNRIAGGYHYRSFPQLLVQCAGRNRMVRRYAETLREYAELRNAIVHQRDSAMEVIAEPTDRVTADIEKLARLLAEEHSLLDYASRPVQTVTPSASIQEAYELLAGLDSTKLPVYEGGCYAGLLTMEAIAHWGIYRDAPDDTVASIMSRGLSSRVLFLAQEESVDAAVHAFEKAMNSGRKSPAILITEHGSTQEKPLGILTCFDLPKILSAMLKG